MYGWEGSVDTYLLVTVSTSKELTRRFCLHVCLVTGSDLPNKINSSIFRSGLCTYVSCDIFLSLVKNYLIIPIHLSSMKKMKALFKKKGAFYTTSIVSRFNSEIWLNLTTEQSNSTFWSGGVIQAQKGRANIYIGRVPPPPPPPFPLVLRSS